MRPPAVPRGPRRGFGGGLRGVVGRSVPTIAAVAASHTDGGAADRRTPPTETAVHDTRADAASRADADPEAWAAVSMLMSVLFADAMCRDMIPAMYPQPPERAAATYVTLFLVALGAPTVARDVDRPEHASAVPS